MTAIEADRDGDGPSQPVDLRLVGLTAIRGRDLRAPERDFWADEAAIWDRMHDTWAGLDDAAWHLPSAAPSDSGGPPWSLAEHVGHIADWQELATEYTACAVETGRWPAESDYDDGDFDSYNERRREPWASMTRDAILDRLAAARPRLLAVAGQLDPERLRGDDAWGWVYMTLHGHYLDHLAAIELWAAELRRRQVDGDPFVADPRAGDHAAFLAQEAAIAADFDALIRPIPEHPWATPVLTPGWTLTDHVGHLADWYAEAIRAVDIWQREGRWLADPDEGVDAWNERMVAASRGATAGLTLARYDAARAALLAAVGRLSVDDLRSPDGWSWAYDCLHGHVRKHLAMLGPWASAACRRDRES